MATALPRPRINHEYGPLHRNVAGAVQEHLAIERIHRRVVKRWNLKCLQEHLPRTRRVTIPVVRSIGDVRGGYRWRLLVWRSIGCELDKYPLVLVTFSTTSVVSRSAEWALHA